MSGQSGFRPRNGALKMVLGSALLERAENWRAAYRIALVNAGIFLALALGMYVLEPKSLPVILGAPTLFFLGGMLAFCLMVRSGGDLAAITWFVLGASIYFGMGGVAGGLHVHPHSDYMFADDTLYLIRVNLLNACSVLIVLAAAYPLANMRSLKLRQHDMSPAAIERGLQIIFPYIVGIAALGVGLKYALFPVADNLALRGIAAKIYLIIPSGFLLLGLLWRTTGWPFRVIASTVFFLEILNGLVGLTKYQVISAILALAVGMWLRQRSVILALIMLSIIAAALIIINPLVTLGRAHFDYDAEKNTVTMRLRILLDVVDVYYLDGGIPGELRKFAYYLGGGIQGGPGKFKTDSANKFEVEVIKSMTGTEARLKGLGRRFDLASIQGYLINEYNSGRPGRSLVDFWTVFIPRMIWPEKPTLTRLGPELSARYYYVPGELNSQTSSAAAPSYSGEAYWNYGVPGVVLVSILLGGGIGWLTRCWQRAIAGRDPVYFLIAFPVVIWVSFVESWVVATYLGEFIIFVVILLLGRAILAFPHLLKKEGRP